MRWNGSFLCESFALAGGNPLKQDTERKKRIGKWEILRQNLTRSSGGEFFKRVQLRQNTEKIQKGRGLRWP